MKKILGTVVIILLIVLAYFVMFEGISIGSNIHILSVEQIMQSNDNLTNKITETNSLLKKDYVSKKEDLSREVGTLLEEKKKYFNLAKISTTGELARAATEEVYTNDYIWTKAGRYATSRGVILTIYTRNANVGDDRIKNLEFILEGQCPAIAEFLYAIEGDSELNFRVDSFKLVPNGTNSSLVATFYVNNVRIKPENVSASVSTTSDGAETDTDTTSQSTQNTQDTQNTSSSS